MEKIGIINCYEISKKCSGTGCINAFNNKSGSFNKYAFKDCEIIHFMQCPGCSKDVVNKLIYESQKMKIDGVTSIHLSTCIRSKCAWYNQFINELSKDFQVSDYTHGTNKKRPD